LIHIGPEFLAALLPVCGAHPSCSTCQAPRPVKRAQMLPWHARGPSETRKCSPYTTFHPWHPSSARCSPRRAPLLGSPAQPNPTGRAQQACRRSCARERFVDGRFHGGAPASAVKEFDSLRYAWYWADHPPSSRIEIPHEPPKRCGLTHQNPLGWALRVHWPLKPRVGVESAVNRLFRTGRGR
jgi:hypothetical protein